MTHVHSRPRALPPLLTPLVLLLVLVAVMMVGTTTASPQFGSPVIYNTLPRGVGTRGIPSNCNARCIRIYIPVCGTDGNTYGNMCVLRFYECAYRNVTLAYHQQCVPGGGRGGYPRQCPSLCHAIYEPVCGSDGKTYNNVCFLQAVACKNPSLRLSLSHDGECAPPTERNCPVLCPTTYKPVCGTDGVTYSNQCVLESSACNTPSLATASQGECPPSGNPGGGQTPVDTPTRRIPGFLPTQPPTFNLTPRRGSFCPRECDREFNPVCGSDGQTYYNRCILNMMACRDRRGVTVLYVGRCDGGQEVVNK